MLASAHATYEMRRIPCLQACVSRVRGALQRCTQECQQDAWESRHAYPGEHEDLTMKNGVGLPYTN